MSTTGAVLVEPVDDTAASAAADVLARAFIDDPIFVFLAPDQDQRRRWLEVVQSVHIELFGPMGHTYVARGSGGEVGGAICIVPPGSFPLSRARKLRYDLTLTTLPAPWCPPFWRLVRGAAYESAAAKMHPEGPHWYVHTLGVAPEHRGLGLGSRLMERALALAESSRCPLFLETHNVGNLRFYRRLGLEVSDVEQPHPEGPPVFGLVRRGAAR